MGKNSEYGVKDLLISKKKCTFALKLVSMKRGVFFIEVLLSMMMGMLSSCQRASVPRPYGYFRIAVPEYTYAPLDGHYPYTFELSQSAQLQDVVGDGKGVWTTIHYPTLNADIHCTYYPVDGNLRQLTDDAMEFVHKHISQASAIPSRDFVNEDAQVYGVLFSIHGNAASPYQFFLTDSTAHFLRGAVYCDCRPNADSLRPVLDYLEQDIIHLIETLEWK